MRILMVLWRERPHEVGAALSAAVACALAMIWLLNAISRSLSGGDLSNIPWPLFVGVSLFCVLAQFASTVLIGDASARTVRRLRSDLAQAVEGASLAQLELLGESRILTSLSEDTVRVSAALPGSVALLRDAIFAIGSLGYLAWLSPVLFLLMLGTIGIGAVLSRPLQASGSKIQTELRSNSDRIFQIHQNFLNGFKQIKLGGQRLSDLNYGMTCMEIDHERLSRAANRRFTAANAIAVALFLCCVAIMIYNGAAISDTPGILASFVLVMLLMLAPLQTIAASVQSLGQAGVSLGRLDGLRVELRDLAENPIPSAQVAWSPVTRETGLTVSGLHHTYEGQERQVFSLGPVDVRIDPGQALFVVGGNGSGKTTLIKLLCGLYAPERGSLMFQGVSVSDVNRAAYRGQVAAVFADTCLFEALAETSADYEAGRYGDDLKRLGLTDRLQSDKSLYIQSKSCSTGERKRIALLQSLEEYRSIIIFDEFAADQDPEFKAIFYGEILDRLKSEGRIVIVVTHDDRYFNKASIILSLERGLPPVCRKFAADGTAVPNNATSLPPTYFTKDAAIADKI